MIDLPFNAHGFPPVKTAGDHVTITTEKNNQKGRQCNVGEQTRSRPGRPSLPAANEKMPEIQLYDLTCID